MSLASWVAELGDKKVATKTIKSYLSGVRSYQVDIGLQDLGAFHHPMLERIIAGIKRLVGERDKRERKPITRQILIQLLNNLDHKTLNGATLHAAYSIAFAGFLRCGEFTYTAGEIDEPGFDAWHLTRKSIDIQADRMTISLPASKTDPFRRGVVLTVAATHDSACAVASMKNLFRKFPSEPNAPLFHQAGGAFTREFVTSNLRASMKRLGFEGNYSGHSFRRGAATSAKEAGLSDTDIQMLGRWKSDAYQLYIDKPTSYILHTSKRFQQPPHR